MDSEPTDEISGHAFQSQRLRECLQLVQNRFVGLSGRFTQCDAMLQREPLAEVIPGEPRRLASLYLRFPLCCEPFCFTLGSLARGTSPLLSCYLVAVLSLKELLTL